MVIACTILLLVVYIYLGLKMPAVALMTSPFVAGVILLAGAVNENVVVMTIAPFIFLATLLAVLFSKREPEAEEWPQICAKWIVIICVSLLAVVTAGAVFGPLGVAGLVFLDHYLPFDVASCNSGLCYFDDRSEHKAESALADGAGIRRPRTDGPSRENSTPY